MAKKKKSKHHFGHRNAAPRPAKPDAKSKPSPPHLGYTAAGAAGSALLGALLARQGWAPKTIAGVLTAVGAGLAWKGDGDKTKSFGAGSMSAAGAQLAMMVIDDHQQQSTTQIASVVKKPANADGLPPGAVENAFERARERMAIASGYES